MIAPFRKVVNKQLGELLVENRIITRAQLEETVKVQKEKKGTLLGELLVELGFAKEEDIANALAAQYGFPYLPLDNYEMDKDLIKLVPKNVSKQYCLIPVDKLGNSLVVAMSNPLNTQAIEDVEYATGCDVRVFISTGSSIRKKIEESYK
jgi:type IV pilus assembly protein PilB